MLCVEWGGFKSVSNSEEGKKIKLVGWLVFNDVESWVRCFGWRWKLNISFTKCHFFIFLFLNFGLSLEDDFGRGFVMKQWLARVVVSCMSCYGRPVRVHWWMFLMLARECSISHRDTWSKSVLFSIQLNSFHLFFFFFFSDPFSFISMKFRVCLDEWKMMEWRGMEWDEMLFHCLDSIK